MPSDPRVTIALKAIAGPIATFRSAVIGSLGRVRGMLAAGSGAERAGQELGAFAGGRVDFARFAELSHGAAALDASSRGRVQRACDVLEEISHAAPEAYVVDVHPGARLRVSVGAALAHFGRGFGVATAADLARAGRYEPAAHDRLFDAFGFDAWTRAERLVAPPLVVTVDGADLHAADLAELLDGSQHIVLVVRGSAPPASLVRLITPGVLVLQTPDEQGLDRFAAFDGPAVAALFEHDAAGFLHDPALGFAVWQRLLVFKRPERTPRKSLGGSSPRQQSEELAQLDALGERPTLASTPIDAFVPMGGGDPADRLATWLLSQAGLDTRH